MTTFLDNIGGNPILRHGVFLRKISKNTELPGPSGPGTRMLSPLWALAQFCKLFEKIGLKPKEEPLYYPALKGGAIPFDTTSFRYAIISVKYYCKLIQNKNIETIQSALAGYSFIK
jgi:hypothetical protein